MRYLGGRPQLNQASSSANHVNISAIFHSVGLNRDLGICKLEHHDWRNSTNFICYCKFIFQAEFPLL